MLKTIRMQVKKDEQYKKFIAVVNMNIELVNTSNLMDEVRDIAEIRTKSSIKFSAKESLLKNLMEENLKAQAYRSRLAEICVQSGRITGKLRIACDKLKDYINVTYSEEIQSFGRTKDERGVLVASLLSSAFEFISNLDSVVLLASIVITDIDKQHYSLKLTLDALNLHVNKENIL